MHSRCRSSGGDLGGHLGGHLEDKLQKDLDEGEDLLGVGAGDGGNLMGGFVALAADIVEPGLATWWNEMLGLDEIDVYDEVLARRGAFGDGDTHEELAAKERSGCAGADGDASPRLGVNPLHIIGQMLDIVAREGRRGLGAGG